MQDRIQHKRKIKYIYAEGRKSPAYTEKILAKYQNLDSV